MTTYVIDANILFTFQQGVDMGANPGEVMKKMSEIATVKKTEVTFMMPPSVVEEIKMLLGPQGDPNLNNFLQSLTIKSPDVPSHSVAMSVFYDFVNETRKRAYEGMKIGHEEMVSAARKYIGQPATDKKQFEIGLQDNIQAFRRRYRNATRTGFLDSVADLDLILLAKETGATLISADEGVQIWGRKFGVHEMSPTVFGERMKMS